MGLYSIVGRVSAIGQSRFDIDLTIYAFIEITENTGRRFTIEKVVLCNDVAARFGSDLQGEFFLDLMSPNDIVYRCQLWGIKGSDFAVVDRHDIRKMRTFGKLIYGILLLPVFGLGLFHILPAIARMLEYAGGKLDRSRAFYGNNPAEARRLSQQQAIRM